MKFLSMKTASILTAAALALSLASCNAVPSTAAGDTETKVTLTETAQTDTNQTDTAQTDARSSATPQGRGDRGEKGDFQMDGTPGKITSIDGTTVTVALGAMERPNFQNGNQNSQTPPDLPDGADQNAQTLPDLPDGNDCNGRGGKMGGMRPGFTESGESVTIDLSLITKDGSAVTAEDLQEGDLLILTLDDSGNATAAQVMGGRDGKMGGNGPMNDRQNISTQDGTASESANA